MSNKQFFLFIGIVFAAFFGWLYYDSRVSANQILDEKVERDVLRADNDSAESAQIQYLFHFPDPVYDHTHSTTEIGALSAKLGQEENYHIAGLTQAEFGLKTNYSFNYSKKMFQDNYCLWVENLRVDFSYNTINVYVTTQYPEDSCEYKTTLDHENIHVETHKRIYEKYQKMLKTVMASSVDIPLVNHPVTVQSLEDGKARISQLISGVTDPVFDQFQQEVSQEQAQLDTTESYRELKSHCSNW